MTHQSPYWYLVTIKKYQKAIITSILCAFILWCSNAIYSNASLPADSKKIELLNIKLTTVEQNQKNQIIESEIEKNKAANEKENNEEFKGAVMKALDKMSDRLDKIYDRADRTDKTVQQWR